MPRFVYASPILPGKTDLLRQVLIQKRERPELEKDSEGFNELIGLEKWQGWLQRTPGRDYLIHSLDTISLEELFSKLHDQIKVGNPRAQWLRDLYLDTLGKDYAHSSAMPELELLFSTDIPTQDLEQGEVLSQAFLYPLRPNKTMEHREFCRQCIGEYRFRYQDAARQFGITRASRYLQKAPHQDYLLIYHEHVPFTLEQENQASKAREQNPSWQWLASHLMAHTGLTMEQLKPDLEPLSAQPISVGATSSP